MEDIKKRLQFNNTTIKVQAVSKLLDLVKDKLAKGKREPPSRNQQDDAEDLLFEMCTDSDPVVSRCCSKAVLHLVRQGRVDYSEAVQRLVSLTPAAKNIYSVSAVLCDLLILQVAGIVDQSGSYTCPYGIRNPPHPLVNLVASRPDSWTAVQTQLSRLYAYRDERVSRHLTDLLRPLIQFVLLEPAQSAQFASLRHTLVTSLIQAARGTQIWTLQQLLTEIVSNCQMKTSANFADVSYHLTCLLNSVLRATDVTSDPGQLTSKLRQNISQNSVLLTLEFCTQTCQESLDLSCLLDLVMQLSEQIPQCLRHEISYLYLIRLLPSLTGAELNVCLKLVLKWLNSYHGDNHVLVAMVILPLLQIVSMPSIAKDANPSHQTLASRVFTVARSLMSSSVSSEPLDTKDEQASALTFPVLSSEGHANKGFLQLARTFSKSRDKAYYWLKRIQSAACLPSQIPYQITCLVSSLLVTSDDSSDISTCLQVLERIVKQDEAQSPSMLPILLYKMNEVHEPDSKLAILYAVPKTVTHKLALAPVLRSLQILGNNTKLKPVAMKLMALLWKQHDRCFPYLQQIVLDAGHLSDTSCRHVDELTTAQAACIREICLVKPDQHGPDVLPTLSHIITNCTSDTQSTAMSLTLEALYMLCQAEVIDIQTAWAVLAPKLSTERRPLVVASVCHFLSLVPELEVDTKEYEAFHMSTLDLLWKYAESADSVVSGAAFRALTKFSNEHFKLTHLPATLTFSQLSEDIVRAILEADPEADPDSSPESIPGYCYVRLLKVLSPEVINDYELFLTSLVRQEVSKFPKHRTKSSLFGADGAKPRNKNTANIPTFLQVEFERNKIPGLRAGLAVGVLLTYDPHVPTDRHGNPKQQQIIQRGRHYHQMLYSLIHEVPLQVGDWHQNLVLPQAWVTFMERCYQYYLEGHQMELRHQLDRGLASDPEDIKRRQETAWLWARDNLAELIRSVSSGSPVSQGNSLCALAALAVAVFKYVSSLDDDKLQAVEGATDHLGHTNWIHVIIETLLCILDPNHLPSTSVMTICQLRPGQYGVRCSTMARCGAALGLAMLTPIMLSTNADNVYLVLDVLRSHLPTVYERATEEPVLVFYHSLALGLMLAKLFEEHFTETSGTQGVVTVWKSVTELETATLSGVSNRMGACLGLGLCLVSMCSDTDISTRIQACAIQDKLAAALETLPQSDSGFEGVCLCLAVVAGTGYVNNVLTQDVVDQVIAKIYQIQCSNPQMPGVALALGVICRLLLSANHPSVTDLTIKLFGSWLNALEEEDLPTLQRLTCLKGTMALAGSENFIYDISAVISSHSGLSLSDLVKTSQHIVSYDGDQVLQSSCAWQLGQLCVSTAAVGAGHLSAPMVYHNLPESSIIRALGDVLAEAGKYGPDAVSQPVLLVTLKSLVEGSTHPLPPLNWAGVLSPILRMTYGEDVECQCLELAVQQSTTSVSASQLLGSWILSPIWPTLKHKSQMMLLRKLPVMLKSIQLSKLKEFLEGDFTRPFVDKSAEQVAPPAELRLAAVEGLLASLQTSGLPDVIEKLLQQTVQMVYDVMPAEVDVRLYSVLSECMSAVPDQVLDTISRHDFSDLQSYRKAMYVRCHLVSAGKHPLAWLNPGIEAYMCKTESNPCECLWLLVHCLHGVFISKSKSCGVSSCQTWLLELMGYIKNVALGMIPVVDLDVHEVLGFLLLVFSAAVSSWSGCPLTQLLLGPLHLSNVGRSEMADLLASSLQGHGHCEVKSLLMTSLAPALAIMLEDGPWSHLTGRVIDWLVLIHCSPGLEGQKTLKDWIKACLHALKHTKEFRKMAVWGRVYGL